MSPFPLILLMTVSITRLMGVWVACPSPLELDFMARLSKDSNNNKTHFLSEDKALKCQDASVKNTSERSVIRSGFLFFLNKREY